MCADVPTFLVLTIARLRLPFSLRHPQFKNTEHAANLFALKELGNIYTRLNNPTTHVLESRVAQLEGGHPLAAVAVASGTSACFYSIINLAQAGDNIVASSKLYGGTYTQFNDILPMGITVKFVDAEDPENFRAAIDDKTRALFCETVSNPALEICDLEAISAIGHEKNIPLIVDSTFSARTSPSPLSTAPTSSSRRSRSGSAATARASAASASTRAASTGPPAVTPV